MEEKNFRKKIKQQSKKLELPIHWESIESGTTNQGIPDLNGCWDGREVWLELKQTSAQNTKNIGLKPQQVAWIHKRAKTGGNIWVALLQQNKNGTFILLWKGRDIVQVKECGTFFPPFAKITLNDLSDLRAWRAFYAFIFSSYFYS